MGLGQSRRCGEAVCADSPTECTFMCAKCSGRPAAAAAAETSAASASASTASIVVQNCCYPEGCQKGKRTCDPAAKSCDHESKCVWCDELVREQWVCQRAVASRAELRISPESQTAAAVGDAEKATADEARSAVRELFESVMRQMLLLKDSKIPKTEKYMIKSEYKIVRDQLYELCDAVTRQNAICPYGQGGLSKVDETNVSEQTYEQLVCKSCEIVVEENV